MTHNTVDACAWVSIKDQVKDNLRYRINHYLTIIVLIYTLFSMHHILTYNIILYHDINHIHAVNQNQAHWLP